MAEKQFPSKTGRPSVDVTTNKTLTAADSGIVQNVTVDGVIVSVPATAVGNTFTIANGGTNGDVGFAVSPVSADKIIGNGAAGVDNKDIINTKATSRHGDEIVLVADGVDGYAVHRIHGIFARES